jgi:hypothetical protein
MPTSIAAAMRGNLTLKMMVSTDSGIPSPPVKTLAHRADRVSPSEIGYLPRGRDTKNTTTGNSSRRTTRDVGDIPRMLHLDKALLFHVIAAAGVSTVTTKPSVVLILV